MLCQVGSSRVKYGQYFIFWTYFQPTSPYFNLVHRIGTTVGLNVFIKDNQQAYCLLVVLQQNKYTW